MILTVAILGISILGLFDSDSLSASPIFGYRMNKGVTDRQYYISKSAKVYYQEIGRATYDWNNSVGAPWVKTPIWFYATTQIASSEMDFYVQTMGFYTLGITYHYLGSSTIYPWNGNWDWARIYMNNAGSIKDLSWLGRKSVAAH